MNIVTVDVSSHGSSQVAMESRLGLVTDFSSRNYARDGSLHGIFQVKQNTGQDFKWFFD